MAAISIHAGHNPAGKIACGATGLLDESKENRLIAAEMINIMRNCGWTVYNDTVDNGSSQDDVLNKIHRPWYQDFQKTKSAEQNQRAGTPAGDLLCG